MSLRDDPRKKATSKAWKFFHVKDKESKLAVCKLCQSVLSYRSTVTNLLKHIRHRHNNVLRPQDSSDESDIGEKLNFSLSENEDDEETNDEISEETKTVKVLESHETKADEESVCLLCHMTFPDQNSDDMMKHMVNVHNISEIKLVDGNVHIEEEETKPTKKKRSVCWDYVTVIDKKSKFAVCNLCDKQLSFKTSVSNLVKHVRRKHHIIPTHSQEESATTVEEKKPYKNRSAVWSFFNYVNDEKTVCACVHCHKEFVVVHGLKHMKKHLLEKHPEVLLHHKTNEDPLFITMTKEDNKEEESEEENMEAEYLEFHDLDRQVKMKPIIKHKSHFQTKSSFERRPSLSQPSFERRSKIPVYRSPGRSQVELPDSLEYFSNYVTSLLQELPEKISKKLQMNFVKQIIEAQIAYAEETNCNTEEAKEINRTVVRNADNSDGAIDSVLINEEPATSYNTDATNGTIKIANGIIIRPIVTTP